MLVKRALGSVSTPHQMFYRKISQSLARSMFRVSRSLWNLAGVSTALLPQCSGFNTPRHLTMGHYIGQRNTPLGGWYEIKVDLPYYKKHQSNCRNFNQSSEDKTSVIVSPKAWYGKHQKEIHTVVSKTENNGNMFVNKKWIKNELQHNYIHTRFSIIRGNCCPRYS